MSINRFEEEYEGQAPWDVGKPQKYFVDTFADSLPQSPVLDIGCGTGDLSIFVAQLGCQVLGVDFSPKAIDLAQQKMPELSNLSFKVHDVFNLKDLGEQFATVLDCCFFHMLDDKSRKNYVSILHDILEPKGRLYMLNLSVDLPIPNVPRGVKEDDITNAFGEGWSIISLGSQNVDLTFVKQGLPGTYACIEKNGK